MTLPLHTLRGRTNLAAFAPALLLIVLFSATPVNAQTNTGLPWASSFETGDFTEWNGYTRGDITLVEGSAADGRWASRINLVANTLNDNYYEHYFGDHVTTGLDRVDELYLQFYSKFESGYQWHTLYSHKIAIINLTDGMAWDRRYQVYVWVTPDGFYAVDYSDIDDWLFHPLAQNVGDPTPVVFDQWDKITLYVHQNTPGTSDGIVRLWINDELKLDYSGLDLRENTNFGMNKLILTSWSNPSGGNGVQWSDGWQLSEDPIGPQSRVRPNPPVLLDQ